MELKPYLNESNDKSLAKGQFSLEDNEGFLLEEIAELRHQLLNHPIYSLVSNRRSLQIFMQAHVFAVWDFMTLLKTLQNELTGMSWPWVPAENTEAARLINEIVLCEESDELGPQEYMTHYELYLNAMAEVGANTEPMERFVQRLREGKNVLLALNGNDIPECVFHFVQQTLEFSRRRPHEQAAAFLFGREEIIPDMFEKILEEVESTEDVSCGFFRRYLERHIEVDGGEHSVMGLQLLRSLCGEDTKKWRQATVIAKQAIGARIDFWSLLSKEIEKGAGGDALGAGILSKKITQFQ